MICAITGLPDRRQNPAFGCNFWFRILVILVIFTLPTSSEDDNAEVCNDQTDENSESTVVHIPGAGVEQDTGEGKIPAEVAQKVRQTIVEGNNYYAFLQSQDAYRLTLQDCQNKRPLCAYWVVRGQCTSTEYQEFMAAECPLACQWCDSEIARARAFVNYLYQDLMEIYNKENQSKTRDVVKDRRRVLRKIMRTVGMDPKLLKGPLRPEDGNWLEVLHARLMALIPSSMLKVYTEEPSNQETVELATIHALDISTVKPSQILSQTAVAYRHRGQIMNLLAEPMDDLIIRPLQLGVSFAIPNQEAIDAIHSLDKPIVEMGAGSGYWTALLRNAGISVQAFDFHGTSADHSFYDIWFATDIQQGACSDIFRRDTALATTHALLLIWPNDPDPVDHPQFCTPGSPCAKSSQPVWDASCLRAFLDAGGKQVVFVGEREDVLQNRYESSHDTGISATREFQRLLLDRLTLQRVVHIPKMWLNEDDMTIWIRKD